MIKFFRKIRQKLLSHNSFSKYLIYAIGEIVLVVIGILIALGINNWNENRKSKESERIMLTNITKNLAIDSVQFDYYKQQFVNIDNLHLELFSLARSEQAIEIVSEPVFIRRTLYFKQLVDSDYKQNMEPISNSDIDEAVTFYVQSVQDMEDVYFMQLQPLMENTLKPLLIEHGLYNTGNWFSLKNKNFSRDYNFDEVDGRNIIDKNKFVALARTNEFQQLLLELNIKWNEFNSRLEVTMEQNEDLRKLIHSELNNY